MSFNLNTYEGLQAAIATELKRTNLTDQIQLAIAVANERLTDLIVDLPQQVSDPYQVIPPVGQTVVLLPSDFGAHIKVVYGEHELQFISPENMKFHPISYNNNEYTIIGEKLYLQTGVDGVSTLTILYCEALDPIGEDNDTNWLLEDYPRLYFYASLVEATTHIQEDDRIQIYELKLQQAIQEVTAAAAKRQRPQMGRLIRKLSS